MQFKFHAVFKYLHIEDKTNFVINNHALGGEVHAPPKPQAASNGIIEIETTTVPVEHQDNTAEHICSSMPSSHVHRGNGLIAQAGGQAIKDGSAAAESAFSSLVGTLAFIGDGLHSAAVSIS